MKPITTRGRLALVLLGAVALAAFALGIALAADRSQRRHSAAEDLPASKLAGERVVVGFPGTRIPAPVKRMIRAGRIAGVILFSGNLPSRSAGRRLIARLQHVPRASGVRDPLLVMIDQEGGLVKRIGGAPNASAAQMGARGPGFSRRQGRLTARNLRNLRVSVNLAPVFDVARPGSDTAATHRGFGSSARRVRATAIPFAKAMQKGNVAATAKHFPGLGAARRNTDLAVQRIRLSKRRLRRVDELPYRRFVAARGAMVMLEHGDLSRLLAEARRLRPAAGDPRAAGAARFSRSLDQRRARHGLGRRLRRAGQGGPRGRQGRHRPAPVQRL